MDQKNILIAVLIIAVLSLGGYLIFTKISATPSNNRSDRDQSSQQVLPASPQDQTSQKPPTTSQIESKSSSVLGSCFFDYKFSTAIDTSRWQIFSSKLGGGEIEFKHPETMKITLDSSGKYSSLGTHFLITSSVYSQEANLIIYDLKKSKFSIGGNIVPPKLSYEVLSDKWFEVNPFGDSLGKSIKECSPNPVATTDRGVPIYFYGEGDAGYSTANYIIVGRDSHALNFRGNSYPTPTLLKFSISTGPESDSDSNGKFKVEIENLLKTINFPVADNRT